MPEQPDPKSHQYQPRNGVGRGSLKNPRGLQDPGDSTLSSPARRYDGPRYAEVLARHGIVLRTDLLEDPNRDLWESVRLHERRPASSSHIKQRLDQALTNVEELIASR